MPHALLVGIPSAWVRQVRAALVKVQAEGWTFSLFQPTQHKVCLIETHQVQLLFQEAARQGGAHIFAVTEKRDQQAVAAQIRSHFRFRWIDPKIVRSVTSSLEFLQAEIERIVQEENEWRSSLYPITRGSPLALPESGFIAERTVKTIWNMCEACNKESNFFPRLNGVLERFKALHLKKWDQHRKRFFIDEGERVWKDDGPYHAEAPFPRDWKYSSALPEGFHFDVQHALSKPFEYVDRIGKRKSVAATKHCNVDAHGYLR